MHQMEQIFLYYLMLMTVYIGILLKLLENIIDMNQFSYPKKFTWNIFPRVSIGKWFVDTIGNRFHANFLGYAHWFMSTRIFQMKDHYISVDQEVGIE